MDNKVFREKSLERIKSPDDMRDYLHISSPRLWMVLAAILAFLIGFVVYASSTRIENTVSGQAEAYTFSELEEPVTVIVMALPIEMKDVVAVGMEFRIGAQKASVVAVSTDSDSTVVSAKLDDPSILLKDGTYDAEIVLERISPLSFLMN